MEQFKKGDYIVPLKDVSISNCWNNFVMKQETDSNIFKPETLINGSINNNKQGWYSSNFSNKSHWRYATKEEIIEYDRIGKPYDVTTLKPETNLEKAARLYPIGTKYIALDGSGIPYDSKCETTREPRELKLGIDVGSGYIYHTETGKWAEIVTPVASVPEKIGVQFEVGKWWLWQIDDHKYYLKISKVSTLSVYYDQYINAEEGTHKFDSSDYDKTHKGWQHQLTDLSEIQQYLPEGHEDKISVKKELETLPEKWKIAVTDESEPSLSKWRDAGFLSGGSKVSGYCLSDYGGAKGYWTDTKSIEYTEITFNQFKKWVLKESDIPKYAECIHGQSRFVKGKIYKLEEGSTSDRLQILSANGLNENPTGYPLNGALWKFKPSTKAAYDAQFSVKSTTVDKWSIGTYVLFLKDLDSSRKKGSVEKIIRGLSESSCVQLAKSSSCDISREKVEEIKWFATEQEAKDFAKTLLEPVKASKVEPMEEKWIPEKGQWVKILNNGFSTGGNKVDDIKQIRSFNYTSDDIWKIEFYDGKGGYSRDKATNLHITFSKALPHEISSTIQEKTVSESPKFKVGDRVRIVKMIDNFSGYMWVSSMDRTLNTEGIIDSFGNFNKVFRIGRFYYPSESLELVSAKNEFSTPKVDMEVILAEAKRRYPIGTQYKNSLGQVFTSDFDPVISITDEIYVSTEFQSGFIWSNGKWAEIVDEPIYLGTNSKSFDIVFDKSLMDFSPSELPSMEIPELIMLEPCIRI